MRYFVNEIRNDYMMDGAYLAKSAEEKLQEFFNSLAATEKVASIYTKGEGKGRAVVVVTSVDE